jgi:hypothetical protein
MGPSSTYCYTSEGDTIRRQIIKQIPERNQADRSHQLTATFVTTIGFSSKAPLILHYHTLLP